MSNPLITPIDFCIIGGKKTPGYAYVTGISMPRKWDELQGYGLSGMFLRFHGMDISKPQILIELCSEEEWEAWEEFRPVLNPPVPGRLDSKHKIWHPYLEDAGIHEVVIADLQGPEEIDKSGLWLFTILLKQWRVPKYHVEIPEKDKNMPLTPSQQRILDLAAEGDRLAEQ